MNRTVEIIDIASKIEKGLSAVETIVFAMENSDFCENDTMFSEALWYVNSSLTEDVKDLKAQASLELSGE